MAPKRLQFGPMECQRCGRPGIIKWGFTFGGEQRYKCRHCKSTTKLTPRRKVGMYTPPATIRVVLEALSRGDSLRKSAAHAGITKTTVARIIALFDPPLGDCPCGQSWGHRGWCRHRYLQSPARQAHMKQWGRGALTTEQAAFCQRMAAMGYPIEEIAEMSGLPAPSVAKALASGSKIEEALGAEGGL